MYRGRLLVKDIDLSYVSDDFRKPGTSEKAVYENTMLAAFFVSVLRTRNPMENQPHVPLAFFP